MKIEEIKELNIDELNKRLADLRKELFSARIEKTSQQLKNKAKLGLLKKDIARVNTVLSEKGGQ